MPGCAAFGCSNKSGDVKSQGKGFFVIPNPVVVRKGDGKVEMDRERSLLAARWLHNIGTGHDVRSYKFTHDKRVCEDHFHPDCFQRNLVAEQLGFRLGRKKLKPGAVPTIFVHKTFDVINIDGTTCTITPRGSSLTSGREKLERKEIVKQLLSESTLCDLEKVSSADHGAPEVFGAAAVDDPIDFDVSTVYDTEKISHSQTITNLREEGKPYCYVRDKVMQSAVSASQSQALWVDKAVQSFFPMCDASTQCSFELASCSVGIQVPEVSLVMTNVSGFECDHAYHNQVPSADPAEHTFDEDFTMDAYEEITFDEDSVSFNDDDAEDPDFVLSSSLLEEAEQDEAMDASEISYETNVVTEQKFVVYESKLKEIFACSKCPFCGSPPEQVDLLPIGSSVHANVVCFNGHLSLAWDAQPLLGNMHAFNLLESVATVFSGLTYTQLCKLSSFTGLGFVNQNTFYSIQRNVALPAINAHYQVSVNKARDEMRGLCMAIASDARFDSPGKTAKYGTNTCMVVDTGKIIATCTRQVAFGKGSAPLELDGLKDCLKQLDDASFPLLTVATDRNRSVIRYLRDEKPELEHKFDMWHFVRNIKSKLRAKSKTRSCRDLEPWIGAIGNHLWWCASNCNSDVRKMKQMWLSILFHTTNRHKFPQLEFYQQCQHPPYAEDAEHKKKWLRFRSPAYDALEKIVTDNVVLRDMQNLANPCHTGYLEVFHSVINSYCSKRQEFDFHVMDARVKLAVIDFNSNVGRNQEVVRRERRGSKKIGEERWKFQFSRYTKEWVPKPVKAAKSYSFVRDLLLYAVELKLAGTDIYAPACLSDLPKNIASKDRPPEEEILARFRQTSKFEKTNITEGE